MYRIAVTIGLSVAIAGAWLIANGQSPTPEAASAPAGVPVESRLKPFVEPVPGPELAHLMGTLQTLTHKLALSADAGNARLAAFYLHESLEQMRAIQREAPEYESLPIAVLIDRVALPAYAGLETATAIQPSGKAAASREVLMAGLDRVVQACNECHAATEHGFIEITLGTEVNPFNQSFKP